MRHRGFFLGGGLTKIVNQHCRSEDIPKTRHVSQSSYQTTETMEPKKMEISPGILLCKERLQPEGEHVSWKEISPSSNNLSQHLTR